MINKLRSYLRKINTIDNSLKHLDDSVDTLKVEVKNVKDMAAISTHETSNDLKNPKILTGKLLAAHNAQLPNIDSLHQVEFQVFSQWGDDGIIQYLISKIDIPHKTFVEFGVENYRESNTRFLLINNNWSGMVMDGSAENIDYIKQDMVSWAFDLQAKHSFITKENINELLSQTGFPEELGILSIDIDGNDYWVWKEITVVRPIIVIVEYNSVFGPENSWTILYDPDYQRDTVNAGMLYFGASITAFCDLANEKGYSFLGCNSNGNNAYFVRKDKMDNLKVVTPEEGFVESKFREWSDANGRVGGKKRFEAIKGMKVFNTKTSSIELI